MRVKILSAYAAIQAIAALGGTQLTRSATPSALKSRALASKVKTRTVIVGHKIPASARAAMNCGPAFRPAAFSNCV